jgi:hypothetical protein
VYGCQPAAAGTYDCDATEETTEANPTPCASTAAPETIPESHESIPTPYASTAAPETIPESHESTPTYEATPCATTQAPEASSVYETQAPESSYPETTTPCPSSGSAENVESSKYSAFAATGSTTGLSASAQVGIVLAAVASVAGLVYGVVMYRRARQASADAAFCIPTPMEQNL